MPQVVAIYWNENALDFVIAKSGQVAATGSVAIQGSTNEREIASKLSDALGIHLSNKTKAIVALPRARVQWQHITLPPCPAEELPDLVRLQADRDASMSDDDLGFDYLPLVGDDSHPHQVIAVSTIPSDIDTIRQVCQTANLSVESIVPLSVGLPMVTAQSSRDESASTHVYVAPLDSETTIWASHGYMTVLLRQFPQPSEADIESTAKSISNQLRRTLMTLSQDSAFAGPNITLVDCGTESAGQLAEQLQHSLDQPISVTNAFSNLPGLDKSNSASQFVPLASLAIHVSDGNAPLVDVLNPRRRPDPKVNYRTYALAATAATLLVATLGWSAYASLTAPLKQAEADQAALDLLSESSDDLVEDENSAAAIRNWLAESPNVLNHLQHLSKCLRPVGLEDEGFILDDDVMLEKLSLEKRQLVIDAASRSNQAVQPFEARLRSASYNPQRGKNGPGKRDGYQWQFKSIVIIDATGDVAAQQLAAGAKSDSAPEEEPES